jgi:hypothetical protein
MITDAIEARPSNLSAAIAGPKPSAPTSAGGAPEGWCPRFHGTLVSAQDLLIRATKLAGASERTAPPRIDDAAAHANEARLLLGDIVHEYDEIPEPLLDAISGAMRNAGEVVDHLSSTKHSGRTMDVVKDVRVHLSDAVALLQQALATPPGE